MVKVIYSDGWMAKKILGVHAAVTLCLFWPLPVIILVSPKYRNDKGLLAHELEHARQFASEWFYSVKMLCCDNYRLESELKCYKVQLKHSVNFAADVDLFAGYLCNNYRLSADFDSIKKRLLE